MNATETIIIVAVGLLVIGAAVGLVAIVSVGIKREERLFRERRRFLQQQGRWLGPDGPRHFVLEEAPDSVSLGARTLTGLWIRRDTETDPQSVPWYERGV